MAKMNKMLKELQKMQVRMAQVEEELRDRTVEATAGGGVVKVLVNGHQEVKAINIQPDVVDPEDVDMLQDLVLAAINEGLKKSKEMANQEMAKLTGGLNMPGVPGLM
jgi:DNA-binding YbaB/EbfC family protein